MARASQAPSSTADQSLTPPLNGTNDRPQMRVTVDDDADVAGGGVQQREQTGILEQAGGRVDQRQVDLLLQGEPREIDAGRDRREGRRADRDAPRLQ